MEIDNNTLDIVTTIEELTYFYVKKHYKRYCKEKGKKFILKENLLEVITNIVKDKFGDCKQYIIEKIEIDTTLTIYQREEIDKIFIDIEDDRDTLYKRLENIIDEFQCKKGFYDL